MVVPRRLRECKLAHWAIAYLAGAWLLLQVLDLVAQPFAWPDLVLKAATAPLGIGFLAVLVLAWYSLRLDPRRDPIRKDPRFRRCW